MNCLSTYILNDYCRPSHLWNQISKCTGMEAEYIGAHFRANQKDLSLQQTLKFSHSPACHKDVCVYFTSKVSHLRSILQLSSMRFAKVSCSHHWSLSNLGKTGKIRFPWAESWDMKYPDDVALACWRKEKKVWFCQNAGSGEGNFT